MSKLAQLAVTRIEKLSEESNFLLRKICNDENLHNKICYRDSDLSILSGMISEIKELAEAIRQSK